MSRKIISPLRYPGGKGKIYDKVKKIILENQLENHIYVEPFAGGAAIGLQLIMDGIVSRIIVNDLDKSIYSLWYSILYHTNELIDLINKTEITIGQWYIQKEIQKQKDFIRDPLILGFSTLFLNRTNRSGVISGGPIGGYKQSGEYLINCRFNKISIIKRIEIISKMRDKIELCNKDACLLLELLNKRKEDFFINMDPPYYNKGKQLYMNFFEPEDHIILKNTIEHSRHPWIITYDNVIDLSKLYSDYKQIEFDMNYSAGKKKTGKEILICNECLDIDQELFTRTSKKVPISTS